MDSTMCVCPLLKDPENYQPDTIDLENDGAARNYWLPCLEKVVKNFVEKAELLNPDNPTATEKAEICFKKFQKLTAEIDKNPKFLKPLSIRTLLEYNEQNLRDNNFKDAWHSQKQSESQAALKEFSKRIQFIDTLTEFDNKWLEIATGVLAGNVFDWGSNVVAQILNNSSEFGFSHAMDTIEKRPWFKDNLDGWIHRLKERPYRKAIIFVDNAGLDLILGILPLARQLLMERTKVVLTANSSPALNDVTYKELEVYCQEAANYCDVIRKALDSGQLVMVENGQKGPCLNLNSLSPELCHLMKSADLVIIEGMGRAVHTNLYAKFTVDSVKLAVLKNEWLANSLGARQFSVIFNYESAT